MAAITFTRKHFIETVRVLELQSRIDKEYQERMSDLLKSDDLPMYDNSALFNHLMGMLQDSFPPDGSSCEIERFCFELDYGKAKGSDIKDAGELWDKLIRKKVIDIFRDEHAKRAFGYGMLFGSKEADSLFERIKYLSFQ